MLYHEACEILRDYASDSLPLFVDGWQRWPDERAVALGKARAGEIAVIRHRHRGRLIVKVLCSHPDKLRSWGRANGIPESWMHVSNSGLPHFDLWGQAAERIVR